MKSNKQGLSLSSVMIEKKEGKIEFDEVKIKNFTADQKLASEFHVKIWDSSDSQDEQK